MSSSNLPLTRDLPATANADAPAESVEPADSAASAAGAAQPVAPGADPGAPDRSGAAEPDELAAAAVELARQAAEETAEPNTVGAHLGVTVDDGGLTMHSFASTARGYRGWRWAVTLARAPGFDQVTVCDVVLLPGADSILAPAWVPWSDRLAPGDLGVGDDLPYRADDPNLVPGYTITDPDDEDQMLFWELGLGRERVVGLEGLQAAAGRWQNGPHGPTAEIAVQASAPCLTCAYFLPVSGFLRQHFGACTNEWSPADGTVVTTDFGCGAHSETDLELPAPEPLPPHILDETVVERVIVDRDEPSADEPVAAGDVVDLAEPAETVQPVAAVEPIAELAEPVQVAEPDLEAEPVEAAVSELAEALASVQATESAEELPTEAPESAPAEVLEPVLEVLEPAPAEPESFVDVLGEVAPEAVLDPAEALPFEVPPGEPAPDEAPPEQ